MCAKFFYILIVLMAGLFPFKMQASETKQTFILYTPYTKISVPPGESISYSIDVINNSDEVKNATLVSRPLWQEAGGQVRLHRS